MIVITKVFLSFCYSYCQLFSVYYFVTSHFDYLNMEGLGLLYKPLTSCFPCWISSTCVLMKINPYINLLLYEFVTSTAGWSADTPWTNWQSVTEFHTDSHSRSQSQTVHPSHGGHFNLSKQKKHRWNSQHWWWPHSIQVRSHQGSGIVRVLSLTWLWHWMEWSHR